MTVIERFEKDTLPPDSLYCKVNVLLEPAVMVIVDTVLACICAGVDPAFEVIKIAAVVSVAGMALVPLTA